MTRRPAWGDDPAAPAVPELDPEDEDFDEEECGPARPAGAAPTLDPGAARALRIELDTLRTRYLLLQRRCRRLAAAAAAGVSSPAPPGPPRSPVETPAPEHARHKGGRPHNRARNDRLLELFETTPERLPRLQRCRIAARLLAREAADAAGRPPEHEHVLPAATARDAIAEARQHRDELARPEFSTDELFGAE